MVLQLPWQYLYPPAATNGLGPGELQLPPPRLPLDLPVGTCLASAACNAGLTSAAEILKDVTRQVTQRLRRT